MRGPADLLAYRDEFPATKSKVFLGSHTLAPLGRRARAAVERFLDLWEQKASAEVVWFEDFIPEMRRVEALYAGLIGADPDEVCLVPSVSSALSSLASCFDFSERNEIVFSDDEFPTDCVVWMAQERRGAKIVRVPGRDVPHYAAALGNNTAVVSASRVSYLDGAMLDPYELGRAAQHQGAFYVIDDFHGSGVVPLDVHATQAHALVCGALKYLLGGPGVAFLYVRSDVSPTLDPTTTGWFAQDDFFAFDNSKLARATTAQRFAMGTPAPAAIYAAGAGLEIVGEVGVERIRDRTLELSGYLIDAASDAGFAIRTPREPERRGAVVSFEVADSKRVLERLLADGIVVDERHGAIRACPHFFSSEDDIDALVAALA